MEKSQVRSSPMLIFLSENSLQIFFRGSKLRLLYDDLRQIFTFQPTMGILISDLQDYSDTLNNSKKRKNHKYHVLYGVCLTSPVRRNAFNF